MTNLNSLNKFISGLIASLKLKSWILVLGFLVPFFSACSFKGNLISNKKNGITLSLQTQSDGSGDKLTDLQLAVGGTQTLYLFKKDKNGNLKAAVDVIWSLSDPTVGTIIVSAQKTQAQFTALKVGITKIKISNNDYKMEIPINVVAAGNPTASFSQGTSSQVENISAGTITVQLSEASSKTVSVSYSVTGGTATANTDYVLTAGTLQFSPGQTAKTISYTITDDSIFEGNETFIVELASPTNANLSLSQYQHTVTITENDPIPIPTSLTLLNPTASPSAVTTPQITVSGVVSGVVVKLYTDSACATTPKASGSSTGTSINLTSSALTDGSYSFYAQSFDTNGNASGCSTAHLDYTLDSTIPLALFSGQPTGESKITTLNITVSGTNITHYKYKYGVSASTDCTNSTGYSGDIAVATPITDSISGLAEGSIKICAVGKNASGTYQSYAAASYETWTKDTVAPSNSSTLALVTPASSPGNIATPTIRVPSGVANGYVVKIYNHIACNSGYLLETATASGAGTSMDVAFQNTLTDGSYVLRATITDLAGNTSICSSVGLTYVVDTSVPSKPAIALSTPSTSPGNVKRPSFSVTGMATGDIFKLYSHSSCTTPIYSLSAPTANFNITLSSDLADGTHQFYASSTDLAGNSSGCTTTAVDYELDTNPVTSSLTGALTGTTSSASALNVTVGGSVPMGATSITHYKFKVGVAASTDCSNSSSYSADIAIATSITSSLTGFSDGLLKLCVVGKNAAGTYQAYSSATVSTWTKDSTAPSAPSSLSLLSPASTPGTDSTPEFRVSGVVSGDTVAIFTDSACSTTAKASGVATGTTIDLTSSALAEASYQFYARSTDSSGNASACSSSAANYTYDITPPTVVLSGDPSGSSTSDWLNITVGGLGVAYYKYKIGVAGSTDCTLSTGYSASEKSILTLITDNISSFGAASIRLCVVGRDAAGNYQAYTSATAANWTHVDGPSQIFRSVGFASTSALANGSANSMSIVGDVATFSVALANRIGVGDALQYDSDNNSSIDAIAFISQRISSTQYRLQSANGSMPATTSAADTDWSLYRAYTSLDDADHGIENSGLNVAVSNFDTFTNGRDLVSNDEQYNIALYDDALDTSSVWLEGGSGWNTSSTQYLKVFTPTLTSEVGVSQRHTGVWGTGARMDKMITSSVDHIVFDGISIRNADNDAAFWYFCEFSNSNSGYLRLSNSYIHNQNSSNSVGSFDVDTQCNNKSLYIWNNFIITDTDYSFGAQTNATLYVYNNTIVNTSGSYGINLNSGTFYFKNNLVKGAIGWWAGAASECDSNSTSNGTSFCGGLFGQTYSFVSASSDWKLQSSDTGAKDLGANLSADPHLSFTTDFLGNTRTGAWDIGAHEQ